MAAIPRFAPASARVCPRRWSGSPRTRRTSNRGFGCTGSHYHWNWAQDDFRKCILNCIVWTAKGEVPADGVKSTRPTVDELMANLDKKIPHNFDKAPVEKQIEAMNQPKK